MGKIDYKAHQEAFIQRKKKEPSLSVKEYCNSVGLKYASARRYIKSTSSTTCVADSGPKQKPGSKRSVWFDRYEKFLNACLVSPQYTMKEFAEREGINPNSTRREFSKLRNSDEFSDLVAQVEAKIVSSHYESRHQAEENKKSNKTDAYNEVQESCGDMVRKTVDQCAVYPDTNDQMGAENAHLASNAQIRFDRRKFINTFMPDNTAALKHGGFSKLFKHNSKVKKLVMGLEPKDITFELIAARQQYYSIHDYKQELLAELERKHKAGEDIKNEKNEDSTYLKEKGRLINYNSARLRELEASIAAMINIIHSSQIAQGKLVVSAAKLPLMDSEVQLQVYNRVLTERAEKGWTAMEAVQAIEAQGAEPPSFLLAEARKELQMLEPEIDDSGITDEEAEELSRAYMEKRQSLAAEIAAKRELVQDALEEADYRDSISNVGEDDEGSDYDNLPSQQGDGQKGLFDDFDVDDSDTLS